VLVISILRRGWWLRYVPLGNLGIYSDFLIGQAWLLRILNAIQTILSQVH